MTRTYRTRTVSSSHTHSWLPVGTTIVNSALLGALCVLGFDPMRRAFGRVTGLWHQCLAPAGGHGAERWSPMLLVLLAPTVIGFIAAPRLAQPEGAALRLVSAALGLLAILLVVVPTGTCVS